MIKKLLSLSFTLILFLAAIPSKAQIFISSDMFQATKLTVKAKLVDEKTREPIPYASVYLVPVKDSVISHFTLSDSAGVAKIPDITKGGYTFNVEYMGYKPYRKELYIKNYEEDLGTIALAQDVEFLQAATISEVGNPITVKQDTLEFNASSFMVSDNAMLGDLLKKMPGIEVSDKGDVKVNGKAVSKITVNGKTFFLDDKSAALNNLPAKVVDKVKVIDKDSESAEFSGIADQEKEKVMDITLKKEYEKGWFGNAKIEGGSTLTGKNDDEFKDGRGFLYSGNAMVAAYNEKTQATFIGNANNVKDPEGGVAVFYSGDDDVDNFDFGGLPSTYQAGINLTSTSIKGMQTDAVANYMGTRKIDKRRSSTTTFIADGNDITTNSEAQSSSSSDKTKGGLTLKNTDRKKYLFDFQPRISYTKARGENHTNSTTTSASSSDGVSTLNTSKSDKFSDSRTLDAVGYFSFGVKDMGKKNRSLTLSGDYQYTGSDEEKTEYSELTGSKEEIRDLLYEIDGKNSSFSGTIRYVEPLSATWDLSIQLDAAYRRSKTDKLAFDRSSMKSNDYYSAFSDNKYINASTRLLTQYKKGKTNVQFGAMGQTSLNEIYSKSFGVSATTGKDEWYWNWSPFIRSTFSAKDFILRAFYYGNSRQPSRTKVLPVLDISNPSSISMGNIYLRPGFSHSFSLSGSRNDPETYSFLSVDLYGSLSFQNVVTASWFDKNGIRYSVPVNSQKPGSSISLYLSYNQPLGEKKNFSFSCFLSPRYSRNVSYQSKGLMEGIDTKDFDYTTFMDQFWGDVNGNNFYSGKSGFAQSNTYSLDFSGNFALSYKLPGLQVGAGYYPDYKISRYSLDSKANTNTWGHGFFTDFDYVTAHNWEFKTNFSYHFYRGYAEGFNEPEYQWNLGINKDIKSVTLSLYVYDILNSTRFRNHVVTENYSQDSYGLVMGRYVTLGVKINFGKMNQSNASRAQDATWQMIF